ncbi:hypothetical protein CYMTET_21781, partial [Cymbomonas tetramitiformis]
MRRSVAPHAGRAVETAKDAEDENGALHRMLGGRWRRRRTRRIETERCTACWEGRWGRRDAEDETEALHRMLGGSVEMAKDAEDETEALHRMLRGGMSRLHESSDTAISSDAEGGQSQAQSATSPGFAGNTSASFDGNSNLGESGVSDIAQQGDSRDSDDLKARFVAFE